MKKADHKMASIEDCQKNLDQKEEATYDSEWKKKQNVSQARILLLMKVREKFGCSWREARAILRNNKI